jgi:hypothetical protein
MCPSTQLIFSYSVLYCMTHDDGRMTETCCDSNIGGAEEELLRRRTPNCFFNYTHPTGSTPQFVIVYPANPRLRLKSKLRGLSVRANYTDQATTTCRRS